MLTERGGSSVCFLEGAGQGERGVLKRKEAPDSGRVNGGGVQ